jgi:hypothetical protein
MTKNLFNLAMNGNFFKVENNLDTYVKFLNKFFLGIRYNKTCMKFVEPLRFYGRGLKMTVNCSQVVKYSGPIQYTVISLKSIIVRHVTFLAWPSGTCIHMYRR